MTEITGQLFLTTDCGLRYVHRTLAREKITNLGRGAGGSRRTVTSDPATGL
ncbi:MAG TPA: hypothetical protein VNO51_19585 [Ilumatobacteraceae bacterium]|nr:hypothetical protein [Ilumatobacteraceae bacterium]